MWQNLYEFPLIESDCLLSAQELVATENFKYIFNDLHNVEIYKISNPVKHVLSHRVIFAQFIFIKVSGRNEILKHFIEVQLNEIDHYAVSRLMELFLENGL